MKPKRPVSRLGFEIAIFCALTIEKDAVEALFDQHWGDGFGKAPGDSNTYITGSIGRHNVVLFQKSGLGGAAAAALAAKDCQASFPNIKLALVVGLCGAVPFISSTNHEIILGDVIIGKGIVDYSLAGQPAARFVRKNMLPDSLGQFYMGIRELLEKLDSRHGKSTLGKKMINYLAELQKVSNLQAQYPGVDCDKLFEATYPHPTDMETCEKCGNEQVISRTRLQWQEAQAEVHFGLIASGDRILNSGQERDHFAKEENVIGFDMASAGVCDIFPSIVIKGVCGYADNHKTKEWQHYAASTAAACTKALLEFSDAAQCE
jgi:nucleoside phosphorylase